MDQRVIRYNKSQLAAYRESFINEVEDHAHSFATLQGVLMQILEDPSFAAEVMRAKIAEAQREDIDTVAEEDGIEEGLAWHRFTCDECGETPIVGCLYYSATIQNYDLCTSCYKKKISPTRSFCLYSNPNNRKDRKLLPPQSEVTRTNKEAQKVAVLQEQDEDASSKKNEATEPNIDEGDDQTEECNETIST
mmetsp:Transcript_62724/g.152708  ORF Transcript_62724/g.152708 Transcript_62724/m.152708 type:complete len:192 (+) Transcript_62724:205-780(+)